MHGSHSPEGLEASHCASSLVSDEPERWERFKRAQGAKENAGPGTYGSRKRLTSAAMR